MKIKIIYLLKIFLIFSMLSCSNMQWDDLLEESDTFVNKNMNKNGKMLLLSLDKRNKKNKTTKIILTGGEKNSEELGFLMLKGSWMQLSMLNKYFEVVPFMYIQPLEAKRSEIKEGTNSIFNLNEKGKIFKGVYEYLRKTTIRDSIGIWTSEDISIVYKVIEDNIYEIVFQKKNREFNQNKIKSVLLELEILKMDEINEIEKLGMYL